MNHRKDKSLGGKLKSLQSVPCPQEVQTKMEWSHSISWFPQMAWFWVLLYICPLNFTMILGISPFISENTQMIVYLTLSKPSRLLARLWTVEVQSEDGSIALRLDGLKTHPIPSLQFIKILLPRYQKRISDYITQPPTEAEGGSKSRHCMTRSPAVMNVENTPVQTGCMRRSLKTVSTYFLIWNLSINQETTSEYSS